MTRKRKTGGKLVWNHGTHVDGLIAVLKKLVRKDGIKTITPGVIRNTKHSVPFRLRVSVPIMGGYKMVARKASMAQEVFVITDLERKEFETLLNECINAG